VRIMLKTSDGVTADVEASSAAVCPDGPSITLRGTRGSFLASAEMQGGIYRTIDPLQRLPRKRSSVATPPLKAAKEEVRVVEERLTVPDPMPPHEAFWRAVYATVREGKPFPVDFDQVVETARYIGIARKSSPFAN